jgi:hypothetical protein
MAEPTNRFVLKFNTSTGRVARIAIPRARMDKNATAVEETMQRIISNGSVLSTNGSPQSINGAKVITTERRRLV